MQYWTLIGSLWGLYAILAISLNLVVGEMGLLSLCHAAFWGIGAYSFGLLIVKASFSPLIAALLSGVIAAMAAMVTGLPLYRLRGDFFALATFGFALVVYGLSLNWVGLTGGAFGLVVPISEQVSWLRENPSGTLLFPIWMIVLVLAITAFLWRRSPLGRVVNAIREDEELAMSLGKPVRTHRLITFTLSGTIAGFAGVIYILLFGVVDPTGFDFMESVMLVAMVVVGGSGSTAGSIAGAGLVVLLPELLRFCGIGGQEAGNIRQVIFGLVLFLMLLYRPKGLLGRLKIGLERRA